MPGLPTNMDNNTIVGKRPSVLGAGRVIWVFFLSSIISHFFFLSGRQPNID